MYTQEFKLSKPKVDFRVIIIEVKKVIKHVLNQFLAFEISCNPNWPYSVAQLLFCFFHNIINNMRWFGKLFATSCFDFFSSRFHSVAIFVNGYNQNGIHVTRLKITNGKCIFSAIYMCLCNRRAIGQIHHSDFIR